MDILARKVEAFFTPAEQVKVNAFLAEVGRCLALGRKYNRLMLEDHVDALCFYRQQGVSLKAAMARLDPAQLGDFYQAERRDWYPLDHAAKIYPMSMSMKHMMVFRLSGYLKAPVVPEVLQMALSYTIKRFPYFATTLKSGFFWHYLDSTTRRYAARPETKLPCAVMRVNSGASSALRVVYYQNRISVEFFHILADGTGASIFLRTLLRQYLRLLGHEIPATDGVFDASEPPEPQEWRDDFTIADRCEKATGFMDKRAVQLRGAIAFEQPSRVLHFNLSVEALRRMAKEKGVTITALLLGFVFLACKETAGTGGKRRKIQIQLPVNMRKFYPSASLRNFSMFCSIRLHADSITTLDAMLQEIARQIGQGTCKESLDQTMHLSRRLVRLLRFVPLMVKRPIAHFIYGSLGDAVFTTTLSNLGAVALPREMSPFVEKFDFVLGPPITNRAVCAVCSYGDRLVMTVTKATANPGFENALHRLLTQAGLEPYMEGSG